MRRVLAVLLASLVAAPAASAATTSTSTSTNWAGYAVTRSGGGTFRRVSAKWVVPTVDCSTARTYSAHWVGLGGSSSSSAALEQIGTETDCSSGSAESSSWYELVPDVSHAAGLKVHQGDVMTASVVVSGHAVRLRLADRTTGKVFARTLTASAIDTSSAEWIVEAPSLCIGSSTSSCVQTTLADVGETGFDEATATTSGGHVGAVSDALYRRTRIDLVAARSSGFGDGVGPGGPGAPGDAMSVGTDAATTLATTGEAVGSAFAVS